MRFHWSGNLRQLHAQATRRDPGNEICHCCRLSGRRRNYLAVERGELHCRAFTVQAYHSREPYFTWRKKAFARILMQTGQTRDARLSDVPTLGELMDEFKTPEMERRLVPLVMAATDFGRPIVAPPGIPSDRLSLLREAFLKTMKDSELLAEAKRKNFDITPSTGEELETLAKLVMNQPQEVVVRVK